MHSASAAWGPQHRATARQPDRIEPGPFSETPVWVVGSDRLGQAPGYGS